jgi:ankyrin repeat protein
MFYLNRCTVVFISALALDAPILFGQSISSAKMPPSADIKIDFNLHVKPILASKCFGCHGPTMAQSGLRLDRRQLALRGGDYGLVIVQGKSAESKLILRLIGGDLGLQMPPSGALDPEQIGILRAWIDQGGEYADVDIDESSQPRKPVDPKLQPLIAGLRRGSIEGIKALHSRDSLVNAADASGTTLLMYSAMYGTAETMRMLLDKGADPNAVNKRKANALHWSVQDLAKTRLLLARGSAVNVKTVEGKTPLYIAAMLPGGAEVARALLEKGAEPNGADIAGRTPLMSAASEGNMETMRLLIEKGANVNAATTAGVTALMDAARSHNHFAVKLLMDNGADVNARTKRNNTAIAAAAASGSVEVVKMLLDKGARIDVLDERNYSPLMYAAYSDAMPTEVVRMLLAKGADARIEGEGDTALSLAKKRGNPEIVSLLVATNK